MMKKEVTELRKTIASWIEAASTHSASVESHDLPLSEAEEVRGSELADEGERIIEMAKSYGQSGVDLARGFGFLHKAWMDTGLPPATLRETFGLVASIR
jgi:hypothetical protein